MSKKLTPADELEKLDKQISYLQEKDWSGEGPVLASLLAKRAQIAAKISQQQSRQLPIAA